MIDAGDSGNRHLHRISSFETGFLSLFLVLAVACRTEEDVAVPESINSVRNKHESRLMTNPGVVSVGIGQDNKGRSVIVIGIESHSTLSEITLPAELDGYPVKIQIMGSIRTQ